MKGNQGCKEVRTPRQPRTLLPLIGAIAGLAWAAETTAQDFSCATLFAEPLKCTQARSDSVVCEASSASGAVDIEQLVSCVNERFETGPQPIVTIAAFGGGSEATEHYTEWNGGTALTTHKLDVLTAELDGQPLYFEVAYPLLSGTSGAPYPGQATLVTTRKIKSDEDARRLTRNDTLLVAGGGGAHGKVIAGDAVGDPERGGFGGYVDGWAGVPCPYTVGVCAEGTRGGNARGARGGAGGREARSPEFVSAAANGVEDSFVDRFAFGGHGGAGHPHGGGGQAMERLTYMAAGGGGGGGSFAWRSTRQTPIHAQSLLQRAPGFRIIIQRDGLFRDFQWRYSSFSGHRIEPYEVKALGERAELAVTVNDPGAEKTDLELGGLILADGCGQSGERIEPTRLTNLLNMGEGYVTTDDSTFFYRVYDGSGTLVRSGETAAAGVLVVDQGFDLVFAHTDRVGNRGKMSIFADSGEGGRLPSNRLCKR